MKRIGQVVLLSGSILLGAGMLTPFAGSPVISEASEINMPPVSGFISHDELTRELNQIERTSNGNVEVDVVGYSNHNREIYKATVGSGDKVVLIQSEIHGNEKVGTKALLNMIKR